jgi:hypothetical protein
MKKYQVRRLSNCLEKKSAFMFASRKNNNVTWCLLRRDQFSSDGRFLRPSENKNEEKVVPRTTCIKFECVLSTTI